MNNGRLCWNLAKLVELCRDMPNCRELLLNFVLVGSNFGICRTMLNFAQLGSTILNFIEHFPTLSKLGDLLNYVELCPNLTRNGFYQMICVTLGGVRIGYYSVRPYNIGCF